MLRPFFLACIAAGAFASVAVACSDSTTSNPAATEDSGAGEGGASRRDGASTEPTDEEDGGADGGRTDAAADAKAPRDANGPGQVGDECSFNRDCQSALRCECDEINGCACKPGVRGTGQNGIDACDSGNQCASSLCVEGPTNGENICSDECEDETDCTGKLPRCVAVSGISAPFCARQP